jgi:hypothetical protein
MNASFWHQKWEQSDIAFHESKVNTLLINLNSSVNENLTPSKM